MKRTTLALLFCVAVVTAGHAQTLPKVFSACYTQNTGTTYRIKEPGLATQCTNAKHTEFSWIDGLPGYDHGLLNGLADDDHPQYLLAAGTRPLAGNLGAGGFKITGLGAGTVAGDAVRFEQTVKVGDAAAGDLSGSYPNPSVVKLQGHGVAGAAPTRGQVLTFDGALWTPTTPPTGVTDHGMLTGLTDDDHPQYLLGDGVRASTNGFAVTGTFGSGNIPITGAGTRLMWYPGRSAFRAGVVDGTQWDVANIGSGSVAFGANTVATGASSTALGTGTRASGNFSTALGDQNTAAGLASTATGFGSTATGETSVAAGFVASAAANSVVMGTYATDARGGSFVFGDASTRSTGARVETAAPNSFVVRAQQLWFGRSGDQPTSPAGYVTVDGVIASTSGGFKFPDGTVQTSANAGGVTDHGMLTGLADDDHPQYLLADGVRGSTNGFAVIGVGSGRIPTSGRGTRLMWYPAKEAFRAGTVFDTQWDDENIGEQSVAFGQSTIASGVRSFAMGYFNTASGELSVALGGLTTASGSESTAMGTFASTNSHRGSFVYGDASTNVATNVAADNSFAVRAQRVWFGTSGDQVATPGRYLETSTGAFLSTGGDWTNVSDVNRKENFRDGDREVVLKKLSDLPIQTWNYKSDDPGVRHLGPTAQDFHSAFALGSSDKAISTVDAAGVALLAIQALERRTRVQVVELSALRTDNAALRAELTALRAVLDSLVQKR